MRWWRRLAGEPYDSSHVYGRKRGRPRTAGWIRGQVIAMARENPDWGCARIAGQIKSLGGKVSTETVRSILRAHNLDPTPERTSQGTWAQFLGRHWEALWATDFFTVDVLTFTGVMNYYVCFFIELHTRRVVIGGITTNPDGEFMKQVARNVTGFELENARYIIHDQDPKYAPFDAMLPTGMEPVRLPRESPNLNAFAERFVRSIKDECLSKFIPIGEDFLRYIIREYLAHYHTERAHQGRDIGNCLLFPDERTTDADPESEIIKDSRLGDLLNFYHRAPLGRHPPGADPPCDDLAAVA
jgi:transposase InsO family protein